MIQNDNFKFVVHKENFLSNSQCDNLIKYLDEVNQMIQNLQESMMKIF